MKNEVSPDNVPSGTGSRDEGAAIAARSRREKDQPAGLKRGEDSSGTSRGEVPPPCATTLREEAPPRSSAALHKDPRIGTSIVGAHRIHRVTTPAAVYRGLRTKAKENSCPTDVRGTAIPSTSAPIVKGGLRRTSIIPSRSSNTNTSAPIVKGGLRGPGPQRRNTRSSAEGAAVEMTEDCDSVTSATRTAIRDDDIAVPNNDTLAHPSPPTPPTLGLVEARPVSDPEDNRSSHEQGSTRIAEAQFVDLEAREQQKIFQQTRYRRTKVAMIACVMLAVATAVSVSLVMTRSSKESLARTSAPSTITSPTNQSNSVQDILPKDSLPNYTADSLQDPNSAQALAYAWLQEEHEGGQRIRYLTSENYLQAGREQQQFALAVIYNAMAGETWKDANDDYEGWLDGSKDECEWYNPGEPSDGGYSQGGCSNCDQGFIFEEDLQSAEFTNPLSNGQQTFCNDLGDYTVLALSNLRLENYAIYLPYEIELLSSLEKLYLYGNFINASLDDMLPATLAELTNLRTLRMDFNYLHGTIPTSIGMLTSLEILDLGDNAISGPIPSELGMLTSLTELNLYHNFLTGSLPSEIGKLTSLKNLSLRDNQLQDQLPTQISTLAEVRDLYLYGNRLTGSLPSEIGLMASLETLYAGPNEFSGSLPTDLGRLSSANVLHLQENWITGAIPSELGKLSGHLYRLSLRGNELTEAIPTELGRLSELETLFLYDNSISYSLPSELGQLTELRHLYVHNNEITGTLATELGLIGVGESEILNNRMILLQNNLFSGEIPSEIASMYYYDPNEHDTPEYFENVLVLSDNMFHGAIPSSIGKAWPLTHFRAHNNALDGNLPSELFQLTYLEVLRVSNNGFSGPIPSEIGLLGDTLEELILDRNAFSGTIATEFGLLHRLKQLSLNDNNFSGALPSELLEHAAADPSIDLDFSGNQADESDLEEGAVDPDIESMDDARRIVKDVYCRALKRQPDEGGLEYYGTYLLNRGNVRNMMRDLVSSEEFQRKAIDADIVEILFDVLLAREPNAAGLEYWREEIGNRGYMYMVTETLASDEYMRKFGDFKVPGDGRQGC